MGFMVGYEVVVRNTVHLAIPPLNMLRRWIQPLYLSLCLRLPFYSAEAAKKERQMFDKDEGKDKDLCIPNWRFEQA